MNVPAHIKARVIAKLQESLDKAEAHYGKKYEMPTVLYNLRGRVAGRALCGRDTIKLNAVLLMENVEDFINRTVPHELAHLIDYDRNPHCFESGVQMTRSGRIQRTKRSLHGPTWKSIMAVLGAPSSTRHSYDTTNSSVRKSVEHEWVCNDCGASMKLKPGRNKKMMQAGGRGAYRPRGKGCLWTHTYRYVGVVGQTQAPVAMAADAPNRAALAEAANREGERIADREARKSKLDKCRELYDWTESRSWNINQFIVGAGCTSAGAATYYARIKKGY